MFIHSSDGPNTLSMGEQLIGSSNYQTWKRYMQISLSTKQKLVFVKGTFVKLVVDPIEAEQ